ncbi:MAG: Gfo/Idh/MocA family protein [Croceivirga sp.]
MRPIKWGIVGPGKIAHHFANDLKLVKDAELSAVASRNKQRALDFAKEHNVPNAFEGYETLFQIDLVDILYVATPHVFHKNLTIRAMQYGKHILCEKPLGINLKEVDEMIKMARENKVFLMEALWSRFNPTIRRVKELVEEGRLGVLKYINADFAFYALDRSSDSRLLNPALAGGTLLDIGIYPVFLAYHFLGKPHEIKAVSNFNEMGTEIQTSIIFQYSDAQAVLNSSFTHHSRMSAEIAGSKGRVTLQPRFHETQGFEMTIEGVSESIGLSTTGRGYYHEIVEVNQCIRDGKMESELWSHTDSQELIALLDEIRRISGITFPFEI